MTARLLLIFVLTLASQVTVAARSKPLFEVQLRDSTQEAFMGAVLLLTAHLGSAAWDRVYETESADHYIDPITILKTTQFRRVRILQDLKREGRSGERSLAGTMEFDCDTGRVRVLNATAHSGQMGRGEMIAMQAQPTDWEPVPRNSAFGTTLRFLCN